MTLTEFLLARIAEDEAAAQSCLDLAEMCYLSRGGFTVRWDWSLHTTHESGGGGAQFMHIEGFDPAWIVAECEAKRRIVAAYPVVKTTSSDEIFGIGGDSSGGYWTDRNGIEYDTRKVPLPGMRDDVPQVLVLLASVYADHPDYREEWRAS